MGIDHVGIGVPDVEAALAYYDEFMPLVGFVREWEVGYRPVDWYGSQVFFYPAVEDGDYSRDRIGLQHICFFVHTRAEVERVHEWAVQRGHEILHEPQHLPGADPRSYVTFFLDLHGFKIEVITFEEVGDEAPAPEPA